MYPTMPPTGPAPAAAQPGRGRRSIPVLLPHLIWEPVLLVLVIAAAAMAAVRTPMFEGHGPWWLIAQIGLLATGLALSLRTATPNLAVVGLALLASAVYARLVVDAEFPTLLAALVAVVAVVLIGLLLALVVGLTSAPAWAVSLLGLALTQAIVVALVAPPGIRVGDRFPTPLDTPYPWLALLVLGSLAGGGLFAVPAVRRRLSAARHPVDPVRFGAGRLVGALVGFGGSSLLAALAGLAMTAQLTAVSPGLGDLQWLAVVLAAVLIGGVSVFGGRGGVAGTLLGVGLVAVLIQWLAMEQVGLGASEVLLRSGRWFIAVLVGLLGLAVGRAIEAVAPLPPPTGSMVGPPGQPDPDEPTERH